MAHSISLTSLSPREAVIDAVYRFVAGIDDNNAELYESALLKGKDTCFIVGETRIEGTDTVDEYIYKNIFPLKTTHHITNFRVDLTDENTAALACTAIAYHWRAVEAFEPDSKPYTTGGLYFIDLVKDRSDGLWKIKKWTLKLNWAQGDRSVVRPEGSSE